MKTFKAKKELLFVVLPKDAYDVQLGELCLNPAIIYRYDGLLNAKGLHGNWQLIGRLSEIKEDVARELVDVVRGWENTIYHNYSSNDKDYRDIVDSAFSTASESLNSIATHLGFNLNDNIYILTKKL